jgi:hypothetical protein
MQHRSSPALSRLNRRYKISFQIRTEIPEVTRSTNTFLHLTMDILVVNLNTNKSQAT